jgi:hypothetical protein
MIYLIIKKLKRSFFPSKREYLKEYSLKKINFRILAKFRTPNTPKRKEKEGLIGTRFFLCSNPQVGPLVRTPALTSIKMVTVLGRAVALEW